MANVLKRGNTGAAVRDLQNLLVKAGIVPGAVDGRFGNKTYDALREFQRKADLVVDGAYGPQTKAALTQWVRPAASNAKPEPDKSAMGQPVPIKMAPAHGAFPPPNLSGLQLLRTDRFIDEIIYHCTATQEGKDYTVNDIRAWHKARGFSDVGYHYIVYRDGRIMLGRPVGQVGAHVSGHNTGTIGISYVGGVAKDGKTPKDTRTPAQVASSLWLVAELRKIHRGIKRVTGHNKYAAKACPSFNVANDPLSKG